MSVIKKYMLILLMGLPFNGIVWHKISNNSNKTKKKIKFKNETDRILEYVGCNGFNQYLIRNPQHPDSYNQENYREQYLRKPDNKYITAFLSLVLWISHFLVFRQQRRKQLRNTPCPTFATHSRKPLLRCL